MRWAVPLVWALLQVNVAPAAASLATYSISGTVTEASGAPVAGIRLAVCSMEPASATNATPCLGEGTATAADGSYTVDGVPAGTYFVSFQDPTYRHPGGFYSSAGFSSDTNSETDVKVTADLTDISIQYPVLYTISGTVTGADGLPVGPEVIVVACPSDGSSACGSMLAPVRPDGTYTVVVIAGTYTIRAFDTSGTYLPTYFAPGMTLAVVANTNPTGISIQFAPASHISGTLRLSGRWRFVSVQACSTDRTCYDGSIKRDGTYRIAVTAGTYRLTFVEAEGGVMSGWWSSRGLVGTAARATVIDVTKADFPLANATTGPIAVGIHAGTGKTGAFPARQVAVRNGSSVTVRFKVGAGFSGTKASVWVASAGSSGKLGSFRKVLSTAVRWDGYVYYTAKVKGLVAFRLEASIPSGSTWFPTVTSATITAKGS
jgi:hypothetical protein